MLSKAIDASEANWDEVQGKSNMEMTKGGIEAARTIHIKFPALDNIIYECLNMRKMETMESLNSV